MAGSPTDTADYSPQLQSLMQQVEIPSYRALSQVSGVSRSTINAIRQGRLLGLKVETLLKLSHTLQVPLATLVEQFAPQMTPLFEAPAVTASTPAATAETAQVRALKQEYERLQQRLESQQSEIRQAVQLDAIAQIESWLLQWPTAVNAVQQNDTLPASRLLPLVKPLEKLLQSWHITRIGEVGETVAYDPQLHQPMSGVLQPGDLVSIRNVGYRQGEKLLYRAKVKLIGA
jgi:molecular chaperone GrpE (heat shock protein)